MATYIYSLPLSCYPKVAFLLVFGRLITKKTRCRLLEHSFVVHASASDSRLAVLAHEYSLWLLSRPLCKQTGFCTYTNKSTCKSVWLGRWLAFLNLLCLWDRREQEILRTGGAAMQHCPTRHVSHIHNSQPQLMALLSNSSLYIPTSTHQLIPEWTSDFLQPVLARCFRRVQHPSYIKDAMHIKIYTVSYVCLPKLQ